MPSRNQSSPDVLLNEISISSSPMNSRSYFDPENVNWPDLEIKAPQIAETASMISEPNLINESRNKDWDEFEIERPLLVDIGMQVGFEYGEASLEADSEIAEISDHLGGKITSFESNDVELDLLSEANFSESVSRGVKMGSKTKVLNDKYKVIGVESSDEESGATNKKRKIANEEDVKYTKRKKDSESDKTKSHETQNQLKQQEREQKKLAKEHEKEVQNLAKLLKKEQKEHEKQQQQAAKAASAAAKSALNEVNKLRVKSTTLSDMILVISPDFVTQPGGGALLVRMQECGVTVELEHQPIPNCILWKRRTSREWDTTRSCWLPCSERVIGEPVVLVHLDGVTLARLVNGDDVFAMFGKETLSLSAVADHGGFLIRHQAEVRKAYPRCAKVLYLIEGLNKYYTLRQNAAKKKFMQKVRAISEPDRGKLVKKKEATLDFETLPPKDAIERALLELQILGRCFIHMSTSPEFTGDLIHSFTGDLSIAEEVKYRKEVLSELRFGDTVKSGVDEQDSWCKMLMELRMITEPIAKAIVSKYKSPRALYNEYKRCSSLKQAEELLVKIQVDPGFGKQLHNIGQSRSKKIYDCVMGQDPGNYLNEKN
ncbi:putative monocarboxylate transporter mch1 [Nowakowskiella sp. JEL0078]|nr:putative monocarboxylate transporter mch1 [Nowakowskiella sp. JEL0078]